MLLMSLLKRYAIHVIFIWGILLRITFMNMPARDLIEIVPDDAFYYYVTAIHIVEGDGSSFDGEHATNGYHPLWMAMMLPLAAIYGYSLSFVKVALALGVLLDTACALLLYRLLKRITTLWWLPVFGTAFYFFHQGIVAASLNGLETSLSLFLLMVCITLVFAAENEIARPGRYDLLLGVALGLLFLARTDNVFYAGVLWLAAVSKARRPAQRRRALISAAAIAVITLPWLLGSTLSFGSPVQDSGKAISYVNAYHLSGEPESLGEYLSTLSSRMNYLVDFFRGELYRLLNLSRGMYEAGLALSLVIFGLSWTTLDRPTRQRIQGLMGLWGALVVVIFVHVSIRLYRREWYFYPIILLAAITFPLAIETLRPAALVQRAAETLFPRARADNPFFNGVVFLFVTLLLVSLLWDAKRIVTNETPYPHQVEMLDGADWLNHHTPPDTVAGAFNAGIYAFFSGRKIVNLDGVINNAAYRAFLDKDLVGLMRDSGLSYYLDYEPRMRAKYEPFFGDDYARRVDFVLVEEIDDPDASVFDSTIQIFRLDWAPDPGRIGSASQQLDSPNQVVASVLPDG